MTPRDLAAIRLVKAREDAHALDTLADDPRTADRIVGFHAQQAVEKALKALLTAGGVRAGRTHDLERLLGLLEESWPDIPDWLSGIRALRRYAVIMRYVEVEPEGPLDRAAATSLVARVIDWAAEQVEGIEAG